MKNLEPSFDYDYYPALKELSEKNDYIRVIDVGAARAQLIRERLVNFFDLSKVYSIGIDPLDHGVKQYYNKFFQICVDNILENTVEEKDFYINEIDQASSLCRIQTENFTSNIQDSEKIYFDDEVFQKLKNIIGQIKVLVYNLNQVINEEFKNNEIIDLIKIDAEGKDFDIVKSIESNLHRVKFIAIECTSHKNNLTRFEGEGTKTELIEYFKKHGFDIHCCIDHEYREDNKTQMSDITFVNLHLN